MTLDRRVLCVGALTRDTIVRLGRLPEPDQRVVADDVLTSVGGPAAVAAITLARLGVDVGLVATVGDDAAGDLVLSRLRSEGVDTAGVRRRTDVGTAISVVLLDDGSTGRRIITSRQPEPPPIDPGELPHGGWVHADHAGWVTVRPYLHHPGRTWRVSIDGGNPITDFDPTGVDLYVPTLAALRAQFGRQSDADLMQAAASAGAGTVVATDGARGALVLSAADSPAPAVICVPGFPVEPLSTLGAGDAFHGALIAGLVQGRELLDAVGLANATAALSCRALDGPSAIPGLAEAERFSAGRPTATTRAGQGD